MIAPGITFRPDLPESFTPELIDWATSQTFIKSRIGQPNDIAALGALLMSDDGSYITGQSVAVDGRYTLRP